MAVNKIKVFKVAISNNMELDLDEKELEAVNKFLKNPNIIYINHSGTVFFDSENHNGREKLKNRFLVISLVYKDLNDTQYNLKKVSKKTESFIKNSFENNEKIEPPKHLTNFEKSGLANGAQDKQ